MWTTQGLLNESDVEQKFLYPLLIEAHPLGLALPQSVVQTKANIRRLKIGKGSEQKLYFPDYVVVSNGFPLLVVEAKHPSETVDEGYRQARLYASELNALYPSGFNPASYVVATNGVDIWFGPTDQLEPLGKADCATLGPYSPSLAALVDLLAWSNLQRLALKLAQSIRPQQFFKARRLLGGTGFQNEEIGFNTFGSTLVASISHVFNPATLQDRAFIARNGYIPSRRRERYIDPIDRIIRAARPPSETDSQQIENTAHPSELIGKLRKIKELEHKVLLLIGSVGSGKSTFIDHLCEVALPRDLIDSTVWCRINMNPAPVDSKEIYNWLRNEIVDGCKASRPEDDFESIEIIQKLFSVEINRFKKGVGTLYEQQQGVYQIKLGEHIERIQADFHAVANAYVRFTCSERGKLLVIALDNCDKKTRDEQLLMFEVAQWLQKEFRCLVVLPLRDETYDNHRDQPPLDTALKDLVFRIEPPLFQHVLVKRVQLALNQFASGSNEKFHFQLPNGFIVEYTQSDQSFYLTSIIRSVFEHDKFVRRMIIGLSGRNMRRALEIFLEFCNSGYIGEDQIFKMRQSNGQYSIPFHQVATVLLRMNRRFYDSDHSYIKNIFAANREDAIPGYFCRYMILKWLRNNFKSSGTDGLRGYFPKREIKTALTPYGLSPDVLDREFNYLLASQCVIAEHLRLSSVDDEDLVRIGPAGFVHLDLVSNINYLAAIAEDTFFPDRIQAEKIAERIQSQQSHLRLETILANAQDLVEYLEGLRSGLQPPNGSFMQIDLLDSVAGLTEAADAIIRVKRSHSSDPWFDAITRLPRGSVHTATVQNAVAYGYFIEFDDGLIGLVHISNSNDIQAEAGDRVSVEIMWIDGVQRRMNLKLLAVLAEDVGDHVDGA